MKKRKWIKSMFYLVLLLFIIVSCDFGNNNVYRAYMKDKDNIYSIILSLENGTYRKEEREKKRSYDIDESIPSNISYYKDIKKDNSKLLNLSFYSDIDDKRIIIVFEEAEKKYFYNIEKENENYVFYFDFLSNESTDTDVEFKREIDNATFKYHKKEFYKFYEQIRDDEINHELNGTQLPLQWLYNMTMDNNKIVGLQPITIVLIVIKILFCYIIVNIVSRIIYKIFCIIREKKNVCSNKRVYK